MLTVGMRGPSGRCDGDWKAFEPTQRIVVAALHRAGDFDRRYLSRQRRQERLAFEPRDELADAHVDAGTEADMAAGSAGNVVAVGIVPSSRIAVGGAEKHQHLFALAD